MVIRMEEVMFGKVFNYLEIHCIFYNLAYLYKMGHWSIVFNLVFSFLLVEWMDELWLPLLGKLALPDGQVDQVQQAVLQ